METKNSFSRKDWEAVEEVVFKLFPPEEKELCSRDFIDAVECSIDNDENVELDQDAGGDHYPVPFIVQTLPIALSVTKAMYRYYKDNGKLPSTWEEFLDFIPTNGAQTRQFIMNNYPDIVSFLILAIQVP